MGTGLLAWLRQLFSKWNVYHGGVANDNVPTEVPAPDAHSTGLRSNSVVAVDVSCRVHPLVTAHKCDLLILDDWSKVVDKLVSFFRRLKQLKNCTTKVIVVIDGHRISAKLANGERDQVRDAASNRVNEDIDSGNVPQDKDLEMAAHHLGAAAVPHILRACELAGVLPLVAPNEAETVMVSLQKYGLVDYLFTVDSDLIILGGKNIIFDTGRQAWFGDCHIYEGPQLLEDIEFLLKRLPECPAVAQFFYDQQHAGVLAAAAFLKCDYGHNFGIGIKSLQTAIETCFPLGQRHSDRPTTGHLHQQRPLDELVQLLATALFDGKHPPKNSNWNSVADLIQTANTVITMYTKGMTLSSDLSAVCHFRPDHDPLCLSKVHAPPAPNVDELTGMNFWGAIDIQLWICGAYDVATGAKLPIDEMPAMAVTYTTPPPPPPAPDESLVDSAGGADGQIGVGGAPENADATGAGASTVNKLALIQALLNVRSPSQPTHANATPYSNHLYAKGDQLPLAEFVEDGEKGDWYVSHTKAQMQLLLKSWGRPSPSDLKKSELFDRVKALVDQYTRHGFVPSAHALPSTDEERALYEQHIRCWSKLEGEHALEWTAVDLSNEEVNTVAKRVNLATRSAA